LSNGFAPLQASGSAALPVQGSRPAPGVLRPDPETAARYKALGWWMDESLGEVVRRHAKSNPDGLAFVTLEERLTWAGYDAAADRLAGLLVGLGLAAGDRVALQLPDRPLVHVGFLGCERAGLVVVGIGARGGRSEVAHLLTRAASTTLLIEDAPGLDLTELVADLLARGAGLTHIVAVRADGAATVYAVQASGGVAEVEVASAPDDEVRARALGPDDLFALNSTSGTTGLPKCVTQFQNRWVAFHHLAVASGRLTGDDIYASMVPAPFGFGLWTSHFTPTLLGATCAILPRFRPADAIELLAREKVTVLACVSTQFLMMLDSPKLDEVELSLRAMYTGGERVPEARARIWEERTGGIVLQFFGSNETGAFTCTTLEDPADKRFTTAGKIIPDLHVRLFDENGGDITATGGPGQPGGSGPTLSMGYWDDEGANDQLYTREGWMLMGDLVTIDDEGYLSVVGRTSDFIIRGGKNISAAQVEELVGSDSAVAVAAVVAVPDDIFGERVCVLVEPSGLPGAGKLDLARINADLAAAGTSKEILPEYLVVLESLPRSSGAKVAKGDLRKLAAELTAKAEPGSTIDHR
jgi:acyl-CoA synthetase